MRLKGTLKSSSNLKSWAYFVGDYELQLNFRLFSIHKSYQPCFLPVTPETTCNNGAHQSVKMRT